MSVNKVRSLGFRDISSVKTEQVGAYDETLDGRGYRYSLAGGTTLAPGKLGVAATVNADVANVQAGDAAAIGAVEVTVEAAGAITANTYQDGFLTVNDVTGEGISYLVASHPATSGAADLIVKLVEPIEVALVADSTEVTLTQNPWSGVVISVADQADMAVGIPNVSITNAYYGWLQTKGVCSAWADTGGFAAGKAVTIGGATVGGVEDVDAAGEPQIGYALSAGVATEYRDIYLTID